MKKILIRQLLLVLSIFVLAICCQKEPGENSVEPNVDINNPLTFISQGNTEISLKREGSPYDIMLEYRKGSANWTPYEIGTSIKLEDGETVQFIAAENGNVTFSGNISNYYHFAVNGEGTVSASGNIISLLDRTMKLDSLKYSRLFTRLFYNCKALTKAPALPATSLSSGCYHSMFEGCSNLTVAPALPATLLTNYCYAEMFKGCLRLDKAPALPATEMAADCYRSMFEGCLNLAEAPVLPATILASTCYGFMFRGCSKLVTAPALPATSLSSGCYHYMFEGCLNLAEAPVLPATILASSCYGCMFYGCSKLVEAPALPATSLASQCYGHMFEGCRSLQHIKMMATDISAERCMENWVDGVAPEGTFIKNKEANWDESGVIPQGWTVETE